MSDSLRLHVDCSTPGFPVLHCLPEFAQTHVHWVSDTIQAPNPLWPSFPPALNLSQVQGLFQWVDSLHQVAKYWIFNFSISPSNEYSGLISFRVDWLDLLAVQGTLSSTIAGKNQFFGSQPLWSKLTSTHDYWKTIALIIWTLVSKMMSLPFNMLSNFIIALLLRSKHF